MKSEVLMGDERRAVARIDSLNFVSYTYLDEECDVVIEDMGRTIDVSLGGIKLEVPSLRIPAKKVELYIALEEALIKVEGEVTHSANFDNGCSELGVRFVNISNGDKMVLERFLKTCRMGH